MNDKEKELQAKQSRFPYIACYGCYKCVWDGVYGSCHDRSDKQVYAISYVTENKITMGEG